MNATTDPNLEQPEKFQLTVRAVATGVLLGGGLSLCNIYTGLKVGWGLSMSITAALLSFGAWQMFRMAVGGRKFNIFETNISQTAASSGAAISSAGLVAPIPALTMITGQVLGWGPLVAWTFSVCLVGVVVAYGIRRQMVEMEKLPFPSGLATGETLKEIYAVGGNALARVWMLAGGAVVAASLKLAVTLQVTLFDIKAWIAALGVLFTFLLAIVAARVSGETNITPVGAMGKVTQLGFAILAPGSPAANLMAANVTGGAASQCADMMHDLKTGHMIGARPSYQFVAQIFGAFAGAVAGSAGYLLLVPDPKNQLMTDQWPAPAVAAWKAVAELFMKGIDALPGGAVNAMIIAGLAGIVLAVLEKVLPKGIRIWVPSPASLGLAFVIPAYNSFSMFLGAFTAWILSKWIPSWTARFLIVSASGIIAGESLTGVGLAIEQVLFGR